jgi:ribose transport system ATP-binding protein
MAARPLLEANGIGKQYGPVAALRDASLRVERGSVIALMGANGAGKSTLVKILTGATSPTAGTMLIDGQPLRLRSPAEARRNGLVPVYQEPSLIPDLDIHDNLRLGATPVEPFRHWVSELGVPALNMNNTARTLPLAVQRIVDLARALASDPVVLLLDEMTAALPADLVDKVLEVVRTQKSLDRSVIYISHRFNEIAAVCDRATVLRDGVTVGDVEVLAGVEEHIVELMLGASVSAAVRDDHIGGAAQPVIRKQPVIRTDKSKSKNEPALRVRKLNAGSKLSDVSFELSAGEVLGVVALEGQGQDELFDVLAGLSRPTSGSIEIRGRQCSFRHPADAITAGHVFVPGDRASALLMQRSVHENIALPFYRKARNWGLIPLQQEKQAVDAAIERLQIDTRAQGEAGRLSGGNQQKLTIARWIAQGVRTLLCFDPTRGIDIRTKQEIYPLLRELAEQGSSVLFYTSELEEVQWVCDRVVVIFGGRVVDVMSVEDADEPGLMRAAYGLTDTAQASLLAQTIT